MKAKRLGTFFLAACFACSPLASAEVKTYEGTGEYIMSDFETPDIAKQRAKARAEQNCVEQAGVYVKSYTRVVNSLVTDDEVEAIANTVINIVSDEYTITPVNESGGSFRIVAKICATVDSDRVDAWLARDSAKNREIVAENKRLQEEKARQDVEIADLRKKLDMAQNVQEKKQFKKQMVSEDRKFLSNQKVEEGCRLLDAGQYVDAVEVFSQAVGLNDGNAKAYNGRGVSYDNQKDYSRAIADYDRAIERDSKYVSAYYNRGSAYAEQGKYQQAITNYDKVIELDSKDAVAYCTRGYAYDRQGDYQRAIVDYDRAIELNPKGALAYYNRGCVYDRQGDYQRAIVDYDRAIELNPKGTLAYYNRGMCYARQGNYQRAIVDMDKVIELNPKDALAYYGRGICYAGQGNYQQAIKNCDKVISLDSKEVAKTYYFRGLCYEILGNEQQATADFAKAREMGYSE